jgi:Na+-transporting methylmalonyl-CoA/oxaloacetate decarboxylase gamma subunit
LRFTLIITLVGAAVIALFIIVLVLVVNSITNPIKRLQKEMVEIESLNYETTLQPEIGGTSEVVELNHSFNQMMGRITELTSAIVSEKEEQRKSELKALQNQINPHFLYNTLDSIIAMIDKGENEKAEEHDRRPFEVLPDLHLERPEHHPASQRDRARAQLPSYSEDALRRFFLLHDRRGAGPREIRCRQTDPSADRRELDRAWPKRRRRGPYRDPGLFGWGLP